MSEQTTILQREHKIAGAVVAITLLLLTSSFIGVISQETTAVEDHEYFIYETFDNMGEDDRWSGHFNDLGSGEAFLESSSATTRISINFWDGRHPIYLKLLGGDSASVSFYTVHGDLLVTQGKTGQTVVDITGAFIGYRTVLYKSPNAPEATGEKSIIVKLGGNAEYDHLELYSDVEYSWTGDEDFLMDFAVSDRRYTRSIQGDLPIYFGPNDRTWVSQMYPNARAFQLYDGHGSYSSLVGAEAKNLAGSEIKIPSAPQVTFDYSTAISSQYQIPLDMIIQYRIHFMNKAHISPSSGSALTEWRQLGTYSSNGFVPLDGDSIDITHLAGVYGQFVVEVDTIKAYTGDADPTYPIYFVLLDAKIHLMTNDAPISIGSEINAARDNSYLPPTTEVFGQGDNGLIQSSEVGDMAYYMLDSSSLAAEMPFGEGQFYKYFIDHDIDATNGYRYNESEGYVEFTIASLNKAKYIGDLEDPDFWDRENYAFVADLEPVNGKIDAGLAVGSVSYSQYLSFEITYDSTLPDTDPGYTPRINVKEVTYDIATPTEVSKASYPIQPLEADFKPDMKMSLVVVYKKNSLRADLYVIQDDVVTYVDYFPINNINYATDIDEFDIVGDLGRITRTDISVVENDFANTVYITASNPSQRDITLYLDRTTPSSTVLGSPENLGSVTISANTGFKSYPILIPESTDWNFIDRLKIRKTGLGDNLWVRSLMFEGISQPGFNRPLTRYLNLGENVAVEEDGIYQADRNILPTPLQITKNIFYSDDPSYEKIDSNFDAASTGLGSYEYHSTSDPNLVADGSTALLLQSDANQMFSYSKKLSFSSTSATSFSFSFMASGFDAPSSGGEGDYIQAFLYHPTYADGVSTPLIPAFGSNTGKLVAYNDFGFNGTQQVSYRIDQSSYLYDQFNSHQSSLEYTQNKLTQNSWQTVTVDISSLAQVANWQIIFSVASTSQTSSPKLYVDNFVAHTSSNIPLLASIPAYLRAGDNSINVEGIVNAKNDPTKGLLYPTLKIALRPLGSTDNNDFYIVGDSFTLNGPNGTLVTSGTSFELQQSGKYEVAVFYDETIDQTGMGIKLTRMQNSGVPSMVSAEDIGRKRTSYEGLETTFSSLGSETLGGMSTFDEITSYKRSAFRRVVGNQIAGLSTERGPGINNLETSNSLAPVTSHPDVLKINHKDLDGWECDTNAVYKYSQDRIYAMPQVSSGSEFIRSSASYTLPEFSDDWKLYISEYGWNTFSGDIMHGYLVLYDNLGQRIRLGIQNPTPEASLFEYMETDAGIETTSGLYPPLYKDTNYLSLQLTDGVVELTAAFDERTITQELPGFTPTRIDLEVEYIPDSITMGDSVYDTSSFFIGSISYVEFVNGLEQHLDFDNDEMSYPTDYQIAAADDLSNWEGYSQMPVSYLNESMEGINAIGGDYPSYSTSWMIIKSTINRGDFSDLISPAKYGDLKVAFWLYISDISQIDVNNLNFELASIQDVNELQWGASIFNSIVLLDGWNRIVLDFSDATPTGTVDWSNLSHIRFYFKGTGNNAVFTVAIDGIDLITSEKSDPAVNYIPADKANGEATGTSSYSNPVDGTWFKMGTNSSLAQIYVDQDVGYRQSDAIHAVFSPEGGSFNLNYGQSHIVDTKIGEFYRVEYKYRVISGTMPGSNAILYPNGWKDPDTSTQKISETIEPLGDGWYRYIANFQITINGSAYLRVSHDYVTQPFDIVIDDIKFYSIDIKQQGIDGGMNLGTEVNDFFDLPYRYYNSVDEFTFRIKFEFDQINSANALFSAANATFDNNILINSYAGGLEVWIAQQYNDFSYNFASGQVYDLVVTRSGTNIHAYIDAQELSPTNQGIGYDGTLFNEHVVLGGEQDGVDSGYSELQKFVGTYYEYRFYTYAMDNGTVDDLCIDGTASVMEDNLYRTEGGGQIDYLPTFDGSSGLYASVYDTTGLGAGSFDGPIVDQVVLTETYFRNPNFNGHIDHIALKMTGMVIPDTTESYSFTVDVDEGIRLWFDGSLMIDQYDANGVSTSFSRNLIAGQAYPMYIEMTVEVSPFLFEIEWQAQSDSKASRISTPNLSHDFHTISHQYFALETSDRTGNWTLEIESDAQVFQLPVYHDTTRYNLAALLSATDGIIDRITLIAPSNRAQIRIDDMFLYTVADAILSFGNDANVDSVLWNEGGSLVSRINGGSDFDTAISINLNSWDSSTYQFFDFNGHMANSEVNLYINGQPYAVLNETQEQGYLEGITSMTSVTFRLRSQIGGSISLNGLQIYNIPGVSFISGSLESGSSATYSPFDYIDAKSGDLIIAKNSGTGYVIFDNFIIDHSRFGEFIATQKGGDGSFGLRFSLDGSIISFNNTRSEGYIEQRRSFDEFYTDETTVQKLWIRTDNDISLQVNSIKFYTIKGFDIPSVLDKDQVLYLDSQKRTMSVYDGYLKNTLSLSDLGNYNNPRYPNIFVDEFIHPDTRLQKIYEFETSIEDFNEVTSASTWTSEGLQVSRSSASYNPGYGLFDGGFSMGPPSGNYLLLRVKAVSAENNDVWLRAIGHGINPEGGVTQTFWEATPGEYTIDNTWTDFVIDLRKSPLSTDFSWSQLGGLYFVFEDNGNDQIVDSIVFDYIMLSPDASGVPQYVGYDVYQYWSTIDSQIEVYEDYATYKSNGNSPSLEVQLDTVHDSSMYSSVDSVEIVVRGTAATTSLDFGYDLGSGFVELGSIGPEYALFNIRNIDFAPRLILKSTDASNLPSTTKLEVVSIKYKESPLSWTGFEIANYWNDGISTNITTVIENSTEYTLFQGSSTIPTTPVIAADLAPAVLRDMNIMQITMSTSQDLLDWHLQVYDSNGYDPVFAFDAGIITSSAEQVYTIDLSQHDFSSFPEFRFVDPTGSRSGDLWVQVSRIKFTRDFAYTPYDNIERVGRWLDQTMVDPVDSSSYVSLGFIDLDSSQSYEGLYLDFERYGANSGSVYDFEVTTYDNFGNEQIVTLDYDNSSSYQRILREGERTTVFLPFVDDQLLHAEKILLTLSSDSPFNDDVFRFNSISVTNSKFNYFNLGTSTQLNTGQVVNSTESSLSSIGAINPGFMSKDDGEVLKIVNDGTEGLFATQTSITPDLYFMSFWLYVDESADNEVLRIYSQSGTKDIFEYDLSTSLGHWEHVQTKVNITGTVSERDLTASLIFGLGTDTQGLDVGNFSVIYLDDVTLYRIDEENIIGEDGYHVGSSFLPFTDTIFNPGQYGALIDVTGLTTLLDIEFIPDGPVLINNDGNVTQIMDSWEPDLSFRVNVIAKSDGFHIGIWEASTPRSEATQFTVISDLHFDGIVDIVITPFESVTDYDYPIVIKSSIKSTSLNSGIIGFGKFDVGKNRVTHYSADYDDAMYLSDELGAKLQLNEYTLSFDYEITEGILEVDTTGVMLYIYQNTFMINGQTIPVNFNNLQGAATIEHYENTIRFWIGNHLVATVPASSEGPQNVKFSGLAEYSLGNITVLYTQNVGEDNRRLVMEGSPYTITAQTSSALRFADLFSVDTIGKIEIGTAQLGVRPIMVNGYSEFEASRLISNNIYSPNLTFTNNDTYAALDSFRYYTRVMPVSILSELGNDGRLDVDTGIKTDERYIYSETLDGYEYENIIAGVTGTTKAKYGYNSVTYSNGFGEGKYEVDFYLTDTTETFDNEAYGDGGKIHFILANDGAYEDFIDIDFHETTYFAEASWSGEISVFVNQSSTLRFGSTNPSSQAYTFEHSRLKISNSQPIQTNNDEHYILELEGQTCVGSTTPDSQYDCFIPDQESYIGPSTTRIDDWQGLSPGLHTLTAYRIDNTYYVYLDGEAFKFGGAQSYADDQVVFDSAIPLGTSQKIGVGVSKNGYAYSMNIVEGTKNIPDELELTGNSRSLVSDNDLHLLGTGTVAAEIRSKYGWSPRDINSFKTSFKTPSQTKSGTILLESANRRIGIDLDNIGYYVVDDVYDTGTSSWNYNHTYLRDIDVYRNSEFKFEVKFDAVGPGLYDSTILFYDTSRTLDDASRIHLSNTISQDDFLEISISTPDVLIVHDLDLSTTDLKTIDYADQEVQVVEGAGYLPTYMISGSSSYAAVMHNGGEIRREFSALGAINSTLQYSVDVMVPVGMSAGAILDYTLQSLDGGSTDIGTIRFEKSKIKAIVGGIPHDLGTFWSDTLYSLQISFDKQSRNVTLSISGKNLSISKSYTTTVDVNAGEVMAAYISLSGGISQDMIYVDNFAIPGFQSDGMIASSPDDDVYSKYDVFDVELSKIHDFGARYLVVSLRTLSEYTEVRVSINGIELQTKVAKYDEDGGFQALTYYIPTAIDTQRLLAVSVWTSAVVQFQNLGLMQEQIPDELLVAGPAGFDSDTMASQKIIDASTDINYRLLPSGNRFTEGSRSTSFVVNQKIRIDPSTNGDLFNANGTINLSGIGYETYVSQENTNATLAAEIDTTIFTDMDPDHNSGRPVTGELGLEDMGILTFDSSDTSYWLVIRVMVTNGQLGDIGETNLLPVYLIIEVGDTQQAFNAPDFGISIYSRSSDQVFLHDLIKLSYRDQYSDDHDGDGSDIPEVYGWKYFNVPASEYQILDLSSMVEQYNRDVEQIGTEYYFDVYHWSSLLNDDDGQLYYNPSYGGLPLQPQIQSTASNADFSGRFAGISGFAIAAAQTTYVDNFVLISDPKMQDFAPAEGRIASYFGVDQDILWQKVPTGDNGVIPLDQVLDYDMDLSYVALMTFTIEASEESIAKIRMFSNLPAVVYGGDRLIGKISANNRIDEKQEVTYDFVSTGGSMEFYVILFHPSLEFAPERGQSDNLSPLDPSLQTDQWEFGFTVMADSGLQFDLEPENRPGLNGDFVRSFSGTNRLLHIPNHQFVDEFTSFDSQILLPGENLALANNPEVYTRINSLIAQDDLTSYPSVNAMDSTMDFIDFDSNDPLTGTFFAMTNLQLTNDMHDRRVVLRFIAKDTAAIKGIMINEFLLTATNYTLNGQSELQFIHTSLDQDIAGTPLASNVFEQSRILAPSDYDGENMAVEVILQLDAGITTLAIAMENPTSNNATTVYQDGLLNFGVEILSASNSSGGYTYTQMPDNMRAIIEPVKYDPQNYKDSIRQHIGVDAGAEDSSASRFSPLEKQVEGIQQMQSSWFVTGDGAWHLKRTLMTGFKDDRGPCADLDDSGKKFGTLYTLTVLDPGTPQESSALTEQWVSTHKEDGFDTPLQSQKWVPLDANGDLAELQYQELFSAIDIKQSSDLSNRNDVFSISDISIQTTNAGYRLNIDQDALLFYYNEYGEMISPVFDVPSYVSPESGNLNTINTMAYPESAGKFYIDDSFGIQMAGSFASPYAVLEQDIQRIEFISSSGDVGILYPKSNILDIYTADGFQVNYRLLSGNVWVHKQGGNMGTNFYRGEIYHFFEIDWFTKERDLAHFTKGAMSTEVQAFSLAKMAMLGDPAYEDALEKMIEDNRNNAEKASIEQARAALKNKIGKAMSWIKGTVDTIVDTVQSAAEDPQGFISSTYETFRGQVQKLVDDPGSVGDWFLDVLKRGALFTCSFAFNILQAGASLAIGGWNWLKGKWNDYISGPLKDLIDTIKSKFKEIFINLEQKYGKLDDRIQDKDYYIPPPEGLTPVNWTALDKPDDIQSNTLYEAALALDLPDLLQRLFKYQDMVNQAKMKFIFLTAWALIFGSAIGMQYELHDLFPDIEGYDTWAEDHKVNDFVPTRFVGSQLLQIDKPLSRLGSSPSMIQFKIQAMEGIAKMMGWSIGYDNAPAGHAPTDPKYNFNNFQVLARRDSDELNDWHYFIPLEENLRIPLTVETILFGSATGLLKGVFLSGIRNVVSTIFGLEAAETLDIANPSAMEKSMDARDLTYSSVTTGEQLTSGQVIKYITQLALGFDPGVLFSVGKEEFGFVGLDLLNQVIQQTTHLPTGSNICRGAGCGDDDDSYKTDAFGRQTSQKKFHIKIGITENTWIFIIELLANFMPLGPLIGFYQDLRDVLFGDTLLDRVFAGIFLLPGLGELGASRKATGEVVEATVEKGSRDGILEAMKKFEFGPLNRLAKTKWTKWLTDALGYLNRFGGGGFTGWLRTNLFPVFALKSLIFGSFGKLMNKAGLTDEAFELLPKVLDDMGPKFAHEASRVFKEGIDELAQKAYDDAFEAAVAAGKSKGVAAAIADVAMAQSLAKNSKVLGTMMSEAAQKQYRDLLEKYAKEISIDRADIIKKLDSDKLMDSFTEGVDADLLERYIEQDGLVRALGDMDDIMNEASDRAGKEVFGENWYQAPAQQRWYSRLGSTIKGMLHMVFHPIQLIRSLPTAAKNIVDGFDEFFTELTKGYDKGYLSEGGRADMMQALYDNARNAKRADGVLDEMFVNAEMRHAKYEAFNREVTSEADEIMEARYGTTCSAIPVANLGMQLASIRVPTQWKECADEYKKVVVEIVSKRLKIGEVRSSQAQMIKDVLFKQDSSLHQREFSTKFDFSNPRTWFNLKVQSLDPRGNWGGEIIPDDEFNSLRREIVDLLEEHNYIEYLDNGDVKIVGAELIHQTHITKQGREEITKGRVIERLNDPEMVDSYLLMNRLHRLYLDRSHHEMTRLKLFLTMADSQYVDSTYTAIQKTLDDEYDEIKKVRNDPSKSGSAVLTVQQENILELSELTEIEAALRGIDLHLAKVKHIVESENLPVDDYQIMNMFAVAFGDNKNGHDFMIFFNREMCDAACDGLPDSYVVLGEAKASYGNENRYKDNNIYQLQQLDRVIKAQMNHKAAISLAEVFAQRNPAIDQLSTYQKILDEVNGKNVFSEKNMEYIRKLFPSKFAGLSDNTRHVFSLMLKDPKTGNIVSVGINTREANILLTILSKNNHATDDELAAIFEEWARKSYNGRSIADHLASRISPDRKAKEFDSSSQLISTFTNNFVDTWPSSRAIAGYDPVNRFNEYLSRLPRNSVTNTRGISAITSGSLDRSIDDIEVSDLLVKLDNKYHHESIRFEDTAFTVKGLTASERVDFEINIVYSTNEMNPEELKEYARIIGKPDGLWINIPLSNSIDNEISQSRESLGTILEEVGTRRGRSADWKIPVIIVDGTTETPTSVVVQFERSADSSETLSPLEEVYTKEQAWYQIERSLMGRGDDFSQDYFAQDISMSGSGFTEAIRWTKYGNIEGAADVFGFPVDADVRATTLFGWYKSGSVSRTKLTDETYQYIDKSVKSIDVFQEIVPYEFDYKLPERLLEEETERMRYQLYQFFADSISRISQDGRGNRATGIFDPDYFESTSQYSQRIKWTATADTTADLATSFIKGFGEAAQMSDSRLKKLLRSSAYDIVVDLFSGTPVTSFSIDSFTIDANVSLQTQIKPMTTQDFGDFWDAINSRTSLYLLMLGVISLEEYVATMYTKYIQDYLNDISDNLTNHLDDMTALTTISIPYNETYSEDTSVYRYDDGLNTIYFDLNFNGYWSNGKYYQLFNAGYLNTSLLFDPDLESGLLYQVPIPSNTGIIYNSYTDLMTSLFYAQHLRKLGMSMDILLEADPFFVYDMASLLPQHLLDAIIQISHRKEQLEAAEFIDYHVYGVDENRVSTEDFLNNVDQALNTDMLTVFSNAVNLDGYKQFLDMSSKNILESWNKQNSDIPKIGSSLFIKNKIGNIIFGDNIPQNLNIHNLYSNQYNLDFIYLSGVLKIMTSAVLGLDMQDLKTLYSTQYGDTSIMFNHLGAGVLTPTPIQSTFSLGFSQFEEHYQGLGINDPALKDKLLFRSRWSVKNIPLVLKIFRELLENQNFMINSKRGEYIEWVGRHFLR